MNEKSKMKKILVIEDNENNFYLIRFIFENNGFEVIEARKGSKGVELAIQKSPDLIIVDIQLPDISGLEVTKRIRASEVGANIPIVAITSYAMAGDKKTALSAGCSGYIEKPINPANIIAQINNYLSSEKKDL